MEVIIEEIRTEVEEVFYFDEAIPKEVETTLIIDYKVKFEYHHEMKGSYSIPYKASKDRSIADLEKMIKENIIGIVESEKGV